MDSLSIDKTLNRLSHEILERVSSFDKIILIGIHKRGVPLAARIRNKIKEISGKELKTGALDITFHRDDYRERLTMPEVKGTEVPFNLDGQVVILIDDVLYTGRTIRAGLDALLAFGRPEKVELLTLIDRRFRRDLPIQADYIGKSVDSLISERVSVEWKEEEGKDQVFLITTNQEDE